jgi:hypothetical protein
MTKRVPSPRALRVAQAENAVKPKARLAEIMKGAPAGLQYSDHVTGNGAAFFRQACQLGAEGIMSKLIDAPYRPGDRGGLAEDEVPQPRRIHRRRLDRPGR